MLTNWFRRVFRNVIESVARVFGRIGMTANALTITGCLLTTAVSVIIARGHLQLGGALLIGTSAFDALDGTLARQLGKATKFGSFLDAVLDRVSDSSVLIGLAWWYMGQPGRLEELLAIIAIVGSMLVSYTRARAECVGVECKVGLFTRVERWLILIPALVLGLTLPALWVLAAGTLFTAAHRAVYVYLQVRDEPL